MNRLNNRLNKLEELLPDADRRRRGARVPTGSLCEFIRGWLTGAFAVADVDHTSFDQMTLLALLCTTLTVLGPGHQKWADETGWGRTQQDEWERTTLSDLTADELAAMRVIAATDEFTNQP